MKQLIFDKLERLWWVWLAFSILSLALGLMLPEMSKAQFTNWWFITCFFYLIGPITELNNGYGRITLTLPLTTQQIGRLLWSVSVGIPTLLLVLFSGLGVFITSSTSDFQNGIFRAWVQLVLMGGLLLGAIFWIMSGTPTAPSEKWQRRFAMQAYSYGFFAALVGGGYLLYKIKWNVQLKYAVVGLLALAMTILGWLRAEGLVVDSSEFRNNTVGENKTGGDFHPREGFGGVPFLIATSFIRQIGLVLVILAVWIGYQLWQNHSLSLSKFSENAPILLLGIGFFVLGEITSFISHLKFLRTLPLTSKQLAGLILAITLLPFLVCSGFIAVFIDLNQGKLIGFSWFKLFLLSLSPLCVLATVSIWHGEKRFGRIVVTVVIFSASAILPIYQLTTGIYSSGGKDLPLYVVIGYPFISVLLALFMITHLLETNAMTYKAKPQDLGLR